MSDTGTSTAAADGKSAAPVILSADPGYAALDADTRGWLENRGYDKKSPFEAALDAAKGHRELEKFHGVPKDQLLRFPKDAGDTENWNILRERLGVPKDVKGYDFKDVKFGDGTELDASFIDTMSKAFLEKGVPKDAAVGIAKDFVKFMDDSDKADATAADAKKASEFADLQKSWGNNFKPNEFIANQAAEKLGLGKDFIEEMVKGGASRVTISQALLKIGQMMGEDKFVAGQGDTKGALTREQAVAQLRDLENDSQFRDRLFKGDTRAREQFDALTRLAA